MALNPFNLNEVFNEACLNKSTLLRNQPPTSTTSIIFSPTANMFRMPVLDHNRGRAVSGSSRLTDRYPNAYKDFFDMPSGAPCIYKSGPAWPECQGPQIRRFIRELRPVYGHPIAGSWRKIGTEISKYLDSCSVMWTSIDPVAFANAGEKIPFCPFLVWIGVKHDTLLFDNAVAAANAIKAILTSAGFPEIEVAFRESEVTRSIGGPKLHPFNRLVDPIPEFRKPFTPTLGLSIATLKTPHYEGTGALYFRLSEDDEHIVLLTAAHVARPPPVYANERMSCTRASQPHEEIAALGNMGYKDANDAIMARIGYLCESSRGWKKVVDRLGEFINGEDAEVTSQRMENQNELVKAARIINHLNKLHDEVTEHRTNPDQRIIGFVRHAEPITVADGPNEFTSDWAFIELYNEKIDWSTFPGNKVYIGLFPISSCCFSFG